MLSWGLDTCLSKQAAQAHDTRSYYYFILSINFNVLVKWLGYLKKNNSLMFHTQQQPFSFRQCLLKQRLWFNLLHSAYKVPGRKFDGWSVWGVTFRRKLSSSSFVSHNLRSQYFCKATEFVTSISFTHIWGILVAKNLLKLFYTQKCGVFIVVYVLAPTGHHSITQHLCECILKPCIMCMRSVSIVLIY